MNRFLSSIPPVTFTLLTANSLALVFFTLTRSSLEDRLALWPIGHGFEIWQLLSYSFLHAGFAHLLANMFGLWMFGGDIERAVGPRIFAITYFASVLTAAVTQLVMNAQLGDLAPTVGASGGVFGVLAAFAMLFPKRKIAFMFFPVPLIAPISVAIYAGIELVSGVASLQPGIAHFAHLGGLLGGLVVVREAITRYRQSQNTAALH